jgi:glycosyltransferase involved in cell wall biosynthesis
VSCVEIFDRSGERSVKPRLRVLIVDCAVSIGGTPIVAAHIARLLQTRGHKVLVVTALQENDAGAVFAPDVETVLLHHPVTYDDARRLKIVFRDSAQPIGKRAKAYLRNQFAELENLQFAWQLAKLIKTFDADIVHVNNGHEPHIAAFLTARSSVRQLHGLFPPRIRALDRLLLRLPNHFISISEVVSRSVRECGIDSAKISVVPNFLGPGKELLDRRAARRELGLAPEPPLVAIVGRVVRWKGQKEFIRSMRYVKDCVPDLEILIAGDYSDGETAYYNEVQDLAGSLGLSACTHFTGHLHDPYLAYRAADVIAHCSLDPEPFGMVVIEAMDAGTPIVAAASGGPLEIIENGVSGFLADPLDAEAFARPIINLLCQPTLAEQISRGGRLRFETTYSANAVYPQLMNIYSRFLKDRVRTETT